MAGSTVTGIRSTEQQPQDNQPIAEKLNWQQRYTVSVVGSVKNKAFEGIGNKFESYLGLSDKNWRITKIFKVAVGSIAALVIVTLAWAGAQSKKLCCCVKAPSQKSGGPQAAE